MPAAMVKEPIERREGVYVLEFGATYFEVHAAPGGRVVQFARGGVPILVTQAQVSGDWANNFGSTFWTSPQAAWGWPPPFGLDGAPYAATIDTNAASITLTSPLTAIGDAQVELTKTFRADLDADAIVSEFVLRNTGRTVARMAHWQISRVPAGGLTFFPTGRGVVQDGLGVKEGSGGITWFDWQTDAPASDGKYIADGAEGWLAHVGNGLIFVKSFADLRLDEAAPGEADVEIYATSPGRYVEIEPQGPFQQIAPGASMSWRVTWKLRALPKGILQEAGAAGLVELARSLAR